MKKIISSIILFFVISSSHAQFDILTRKIKDKINSKIGKVIGTKSVESSVDSIPSSSTDSNDEVIPNSANKNTNTPKVDQKPIEFIKTGKLDIATKMFYAVDYDFVLQNQLGQKALTIARNKGLKGTDREVFDKARTDSILMKKIWTDLSLEKLPPDAQEIQEKFKTASTFEALALPSTTVLVTDKFIKSTLNGIGNTKQKPMLLAAFQADGISIVDVGNNVSNTIGTIMDIPYTIEDKDFDVSTIFNMAKLGEQYLKKEGAKSEVSLNKKAFGYLCNIAKIEAPVRPIKKGSTDDDSSLWFHCLLNNDFNDLVNKNYNPKYKIIIELFYTHDLDKILPKIVTTKKNKINVDGFFVGAVIRDELGHGVAYKIQDIKPLQKIDSGEFQIPMGYPKMTHEQLKDKIIAKMKNKK